jgi:DNA polymerase-3 subunit epsilon
LPVSALVRPGIPLPKVSTLIHRITPQAIAQAPPLADVLPGFIDFCRGTLLVGHHVGLDMGFLNRACRKHLGAPLANPCLDTMRMAMLWRERGEPVPTRGSMPGFPTPCPIWPRKYGLSRFQAHDALGDAMQTAYLFIYLAKK